MTDKWLKACMLGLLAVCVAVLGGCVIAGRDSAVTDGLLALTGAAGGLGLWERLKK
jgi:hypothetical protein